MNLISAIFFLSIGISPINTDIIRNGVSSPFFTHLSCETKIANIVKIGGSMETDTKHIRGLYFKPIQDMYVVFGSAGYRGFNVEYYHSCRHTIFAHDNFYQCFDIGNIAYSLSYSKKIFIINSKVQIGYSCISQYYTYAPFENIACSYNGFYFRLKSVYDFKNVQFYYDVSATIGSYLECIIGTEYKINKMYIGYRVVSKTESMVTLVPRQSNKLQLYLKISNR